MTTRPYVGVTGYASLAQSSAVTAAVSHLLHDRILMDGFLLQPHEASARWQAVDDRYAKFAPRFLHADSADEIFTAPRTGSLRIVHFCTTIETRLDEQLQDCVDRFGAGIDGFQINRLAQASPIELGSFKRSVDLTRLANGLEPLLMALQLQPEILAVAENQPDYLVEYVSNYVNESAITHLLYDPSHGLGIEFDPDEAIAVVSKIRMAFPELQLGVAGGLSPENVREKVAPIWRNHPDVCIDVEGRVRDGNDHFDLDRAIAYVRAALELGQEVLEQTP